MLFIHLIVIIITFLLSLIKIILVKNHGQFVSRYLGKILINILQYFITSYSELVFLHDGCNPRQIPETTVY